MKKAISISVFLIILFVLPLAPEISLLFNWKVLFAAAICVLLLWTQPIMSASESREHKATDRGTMWWIVVVSCVGMLTSLIDWAYLQLYHPETIHLTIAGVVMMVSGISLRIWAIRTLSNAFSASVQIKPGQKLITSGPYRLLRHPSYTGAWVLMMGVAVLFNSWAGFVLMGPGMFIVYNFRIKTEESTLRAEYGEHYSAYCRKTRKLFPYLY